MKYNELTWLELCEVIDNHINIKRDFTILCDEITALDIVDYVEDIEFSEKNVILNNNDEYMVSYSHFKGESFFGVEPLRCKNIEIKGHETKDLFINLDLDEDEVEDKIECETLSYFELSDCADDYEEIDEDESCECLDCLTNRYVKMLQEACCPECTKKILVSYLGEVLGRIEEDDE